MSLNLSIVVPTYNKPSFLNELLDSIKKNNCHFELVLTDDFSTDSDVHKILDSLSKSFQANIDITIVKNDKNVGIAENTNRGVMASSGKYVALVDADDYLSGGAIDYLNKLLSDSSPDWGFTNRWDVHDFGRLIYQDYGNQHFLKHIPLKEALLFDMVASHLKFYKRDLFNYVGLFDSKYNLAIDYDMALRMASYSNNFMHIASPLYFHRISSEQSTQKNWLEQVRQANQIRSRYLPALPQAMDGDSSLPLALEEMLSEYICLDNYPLVEPLWVASIENKLYRFDTYHNFIEFVGYSKISCDYIFLSPKTVLPKSDLLLLRKKVLQNLILFYDNELNSNLSWFQFYSSYFTKIICRNPSDAMALALACGDREKIILKNSTNL
jgi:glycosyltransferase involved in cell wall biosynthesis